MTQIKVARSNASSRVVSPNSSQTQISAAILPKTTTQTTQTSHTQKSVNTLSGTPKQSVSTAGSKKGQAITATNKKKSTFNYKMKGTTSGMLSKTTKNLGAKPFLPQPSNLVGKKMSLAKTKNFDSTAAFLARKQKTTPGTKEPPTIMFCLDMPQPAVGPAS